MNAYVAMKNRHQEEVNALPFKAAFSDEQFAKGMAELGLTPSDTDKVYALSGTGIFYLRSDAPRIHETFERHRKERADAIAADKDGTGFICDMFRYELANHEYCITFDLGDTLDALGFTVDEINENAALLNGLDLARQKYLQEAEEKGWG